MIAHFLFLHIRYLFFKIFGKHKEGLYLLNFAHLLKKRDTVTFFILYL